MGLRKLLRLLVGFSLIVLGIIGLILPVMPGWVFLIPGLVILADYFPPVRRLVDWARRRMNGEKAPTGAGGKEDQGTRIPRTPR